MVNFTDDYEDEIKVGNEKVAATPANVDALLNEDKQSVKLAKQAQTIMIKQAMVTVKPNHEVQETKQSVDMIKELF
jgi:hypothetical protein